MKAENCNTVGDKFVKNDKGELEFTDAGKHLVLKEHCERLFNEEFPWDKENLAREYPVIGPQTQINKERVKSALTKMNNCKASGTSGIVAQMLVSGDAGLERMTSSLTVY